MMNIKRLKDINDLADDSGEELKQLEVTLANIEFLKPVLYKRMDLMGKLAVELAEGLSLQVNNSFILAAFYANLSFISIEEYLYKDKYVNNFDLDLIKRHVSIGYELLLKKKLLKAAEYVKYHHEVPSGDGYFKQQNDNKLISCLEIADCFITEVLYDPLKPEPPLMCLESIEKMENKYNNGKLINEEELKRIKILLKDFYETNCK